MRTYIRTDRNGTKIYLDDTCRRCGGAGTSLGWHLDGGRCWECGGTGRSKDREIKEYTPEYRAVLNERARKRAEKKKEERRAKFPEWKKKLGFAEGFIHVVSMRDSYGHKEEIKAAGGRYNQFAGWFFSEAHEEFQTIPMSDEECLIELDGGYLDWRNDIKDKMMAKVRAQISSESKSEYIGSVGDKFEGDVTHVRTGSFDTRFGTTFVHTFEDGDGNIFVWKTGTCGGFDEKELHIKGTIKEHSEYNGEKQTVLTRVKVM